MTSENSRANSRHYCYVTSTKLQRLKLRNIKSRPEYSRGKQSPITTSLYN